MAKKGVYRISGNLKPKIGEKTFYNVDEWYPATPHSDRNLAKITWELFIKDESGNGFRTTNIKKKGINHFTFGKNAYKFTYKVEGYLHEPEGNSPMSMIVQPQKDENKPKPKEKDVLGVSLTYEDGSKISKALSYRDRLKATAKCDGMEGEGVVFTLWEDDSEKAGHNKNNQHITKSPAVKVNKYGKAEYIFSLSPTFISLANKREDEKKQHEYYVTAEYNGRIDASGNVNVNNPDVPKPAPSPSKPKPKDNTAKFPSSTTSSKKQSDPKGKIMSAEFVGNKGQKISSAKIGDIVSIKITSQNMVGKVVMVRIYEDDNFNDDFLFGQKVKIYNDTAFINNVKLTNEMYDEGKRWEVENKTQHFFIEVEHLSISTESQRIDVGLNEEPKKIEIPLSPAKKENTEIGKGDDSCVCKDEYKLIWGNKISCAERKKVVEVCKNIWGESNKIEKAKELMAIMHLETAGSFSPSKKGVSVKGTKYIGLVQFSETTAESLGTSYNSLGKMTFIDQMVYVEKYLKKNKDRMKTLVDFYLQVLNPAAVGKGSDPNYKVFDESIEVPDGNGSTTSEKQRNINITKDRWVTKYGYSSNPTFMKGDERTKRKKWVYTRQRFEDRYGYENGNTTIKEIDDVVRLEHYNPGKAELYVEECVNKPVQKKDGNGKRAPWVDVAFEEFEKFKGKTEVESPLKERVAEYFKLSGFPNLNHTDSWCATFIFWCFQHTKDYKDTNVSGNVGAFDWGEENNSKIINNDSKDGWLLGEKSEVFVGAIIVFTFSHVAIIVGENLAGDSYVYLGANQGSNKTGGQKICFGSVLKTDSKIYMIMKPKKYTIGDDEKLLPRYDVNSENSNTSSR